MTIRISHLGKKQFEGLLPDLVAIYESAYEDLPEYSYHGQGTIAEYLEWLYAGDPQGFFVAYDDGQPVAFESVHGSWSDRQGETVAEIHELVVRKDYQGKGVGGKLLRLALDYAKSMGRKKVGLWVGENNTRAAAIYERMGFVDVSRWGIWRRMTLDLPEVNESGQNVGQSL